MFPLFWCLDTWSSPAVAGERPPPILGFSYSKISDYEVAMFGGYAVGRKLNDLYILRFTDFVCYVSITIANTYIIFIIACTLCSCGETRDGPMALCKKPSLLMCAG